MNSLGFSPYEVMSSENRDNFTYFFLIWNPFASFSYFISLSQTSNTMLITSNESKNPCFFPYLRTKAQFFITEYGNRYGFFHTWPLSSWRFTLLLIVKSFYDEGMLNFDTHSFQSNWDNHVGFSPYSINVAFYITFSHVKTSLHSRNNFVEHFHQYS